MVRAEAFGINKDFLDQATTVAVKMLKGDNKEIKVIDEFSAFCGSKRHGLFFR